MDSYIKEPMKPADKSKCYFTRVIKHVSATEITVCSNIYIIKMKCNAHETQCSQTGLRKAQ